MTSTLLKISKERKAGVGKVESHLLLIVHDQRHVFLLKCKILDHWLYPGARQYSSWSYNIAMVNIAKQEI
ncbi:hypothetical protein DPMN_137919 [Dreissena polymorpha]|uniref:Uncharacterized protein n=1 Tax=Dreissena polymorpha TaxID=45954 RepID=A0A9D4G652_DREPO|nr:hypothetical protein DPMN_137919 [Dreissena polymorpha]